MHNKNIFITPSEFEFPAVSTEQATQIRSALKDRLKITCTHISEAASYSMAMVARFALGLSADRADVCVFANHSLAGVVALATTRHLFNAGSQAKIFVFKSCLPENPAFLAELEILKAMGIEIQDVEAEIDEQTSTKLNEAILASHNVILGLFDVKLKGQQYKKLVEILNEARTPVHCIDCPLGLDADSGTPSDSPLFASSTLSLGTVFNGLYAGETYVGRHYLCDISLNKDLYVSVGHDLTPLFSEQPVIKIFPKKAKDEDE